MNERLDLSECYNTTPDQKDISTKLTFNKKDFIEKPELQLVELNRFKSKVYAVIDNYEYKNKEILKKALID